MIVLGEYKGKWGILVRIEKFSSKTHENQLPTFQSLVFHSRIVFEVRTFFSQTWYQQHILPLNVSEHWCGSYLS